MLLPFKLRIPFLSKKVVSVSIEDVITAAQEEAALYPLVLSNNKLQGLIDKKFMTEEGIQLPPKEFLGKIVSFIEKSQPQTKEEFAVFVDHLFTTLPTPSSQPKKRRFPWQ